MKRTSGGLSGDGGAARGAQKGETMAQKTFARPLMFTRQALWRLILPLVLEQLLLVTVLIWPSSFTLPTALRAAGDARFTMVTSMVSMWVFRIGMSYVLGAWLGMGLFGVWTAMQIDWAVRSLVFGVRFLGHKWEKARVLEG